MLIDRADNAIHICEAKYYNTEYLLTSKEAQKLRERKALFQSATRNKKQLITTLITTYGILENKYASSIDQVLTMDDLFHIKTTS